MFICKICSISHLKKVIIIEYYSYMEPLKSHGGNYFLPEIVLRYLSINFAFIHNVLCSPAILSKTSFTINFEVPCNKSSYSCAHSWWLYTVATLPFEMSNEQKMHHVKYNIISSFCIICKAIKYTGSVV